MWALSSYSFHYLFMVTKQPLVSNLKSHCFHLDSSLKRFSNIPNWLSWIPTQSSLVNSELLFFITILYNITPLVQVFCLQFSILTIIYFILGVNSGSLTFLLSMSANCRPPSHHIKMKTMLFLIDSFHVLHTFQTDWVESQLNLV